MAVNIRLPAHMLADHTVLAALDRLVRALGGAGDADGEPAFELAGTGGAAAFGTPRQQGLGVPRRACHDDVVLDALDTLGVGTGRGLDVGPIPGHHAISICEAGYQMWVDSAPGLIGALELLRSQVRRGATAARFDYVVDRVSVSEMTGEGRSLMLRASYDLLRGGGVLLLDARTAAAPPGDLLVRAMAARRFAQRASVWTPEGPIVVLERLAD